MALQDIVAEATRETFTKTAAQRGEKSWEGFLKERLFEKARSAGVSLALELASPDGFWGKMGTGAELKFQPESKLPGDTATLVLTGQEPVFQALSGISFLPSISMKLKAVAIIQMREEQ